MIWISYLTTHWFVLCRLVWVWWQRCTRTYCKPVLINQCCSEYEWIRAVMLNFNIIDLYFKVTSHRYTRVAFYISGLENKINHRKSIYCFSKYSPLRSIHFCIHIWTNCRSTFATLFYVREKKEVIRCQVRTLRRMIHQIDVFISQKWSCLSRCVRARNVVVKSDPSSAFGSLDFLEDSWQINGCVPLRINCSTLF